MTTHEVPDRELDPAARKVLDRELYLAALHIVREARATAQSVGVAGSPKTDQQPSPPVGPQLANDVVNQALESNPKGLAEQLGLQLRDQAAADQRLCYSVIGLMGVVVLVVLAMVVYAVVSEADRRTIPVIAAVTTTVLSGLSGYAIKPKQLLDRVDASRKAVNQFEKKLIVYAAAIADCDKLTSTDPKAGRCRREAAEKFVRSLR